MRDQVDISRVGLALVLALRVRQWYPPPVSYCLSRDSELTMFWLGSPPMGFLLSGQRGFATFPGSLHYGLLVHGDASALKGARLPGVVHYTAVDPSSSTCGWPRRHNWRCFHLSVLVMQPEPPSWGPVELGNVYETYGYLLFSEDQVDVSWRISWDSCTHVRPGSSKRGCGGLDLWVCDPEPANFSWGACPMATASLRPRARPDLRAFRWGQASNPGPLELKIASVNVTSLLGNVDLVDALPVDCVCLQEVRVAPGFVLHPQRAPGDVAPERWTLHTGDPGEDGAALVAVAVRGWPSRLVDKSHRWVTVLVHGPQQSLLITSAYAPVRSGRLAPVQDALLDALLPLS